jgi:hypothetical protein
MEKKVEKGYTNEKLAGGKFPSYNLLGMKIERFLGKLACAHMVVFGVQNYE